MKKPPQIKLKKLENNPNPKFIWAESNKYILQYPDGSESEPVILDMAKRKKLLASVIIPFYTLIGETYIYLRSVPRPPIVDFDGTEAGNLWELPAGLVDEGETPQEAARRELKEEVGFETETLSELFMLYEPFYPNPGMSAEKLYMFGVVVDPEKRGEPTLDGSPMERNAEIIEIDINEALTRVNQGYLKDAKTELGIRRLYNYLAFIS